jgi:putative ABC transport system substrate-binding protein
MSEMLRFLDAALHQGSMRRREFIALGGGAGMWPIVAHAQQSERVRRIGVLVGAGADDMEAQARQTAFRQRLQELGWTDGRNVQIDARWGAANPDEVRRYAMELAALAPDVIVAAGNAPVERLLEATRAVPIVFAIVLDPVGSGLVDNLSQPGGNATGFMQFEYSLAAKWVELLKQIAPSVTRAAVLRDATVAAGIGQFAVIQSVAPSAGIEVSPINGRNASEIELAVEAFARNPNGGLIVAASALAGVHRDLIIALAGRHKLPAVFSSRAASVSGGLISYGANLVDLYRRAAGYVDRILRGEKPGGLPVQAPTRYELVINLKTAKMLGLTVPPTLLARADEVIE